MARARKRVSNKDAGKNECCKGKSGKFAVCGLALILLGLLIKVGWSISDLLLLVGAIFVVKGILLSAFRK